ncbi:MAG: phenylalanine--tRNA ligase subunit beta [Chloroflexota bacterium]
MRVPLDWLRDYVDIELAPAALAEELTMRGMEVSAIEVSGADWTDVIVGRLLEVQRHPNADMLWLTSVDVGTGEPLSIVCGAQNLAVGQLVPVAVVGAVLPGDRRIERSKIRGVVSHGMLCSAAELGLGSDADGIHILGTHDEHALGMDLRQLFGETVIDVDVKPNRGDALSMVGLAREIAAFSGGQLRLPPTSVVEASQPRAEERVSVRIEEPELCPRFTARLLTNVSNGASPDWMQRRLVAAGMRPISAVVDVTNYVMHELGQPQHAYDADTVPDGEIIVRRGRPGETLETIDHQVRQVDERMLVIADRERPIGLAGIMGGASTEVTDATTNVILESAIFDGPTIRNTARRLALRSEASARHEKGIGPDLPRIAADRAAQLIAEITGATVAAGIVDNDPADKPLRRIEVDLARASRLIGVELDAAAAERLLTPLGFAVEGGSGAVSVSVPPYRVDVLEAVDVAEELARAHGYAAIPGRLPTAELPPYRPDPTHDRHAVRRILAGLGLDEVLSHALIGPSDLRRSGYDPDADGTVRVFNPISDEHSILRPVLYPSLLAALDENVRQRRGSAWIFEVGKTYRETGDQPLPPGAETAGTGRSEAWHVGIALLGPRIERGLGSDPRQADVAELKGIVEALHGALGLDAPAYRPESAEERHPHLHPGRAARLVDAAGRPYGSIGELHPEVAAAWDLPGRPVLAAINLPQLFALRPTERRVKPVPAAQPIDRDLAVVVTDATPLGDVLRIARSSAGPTLASLRVFDEYRGAQIGEGRVSYAIALRFQPERSGDEKGVDKALNKVRGSLRHHLGAEIR